MIRPWQPGPAAGSAGPLHAVATEFLVPGWRARLAFMRRSIAVGRQARASEGMVGMLLEADLRRGVFRTVSVWTGPEAARAFGRSGPHLEAMRAVPVGRGSIGAWEVGADELPIGLDTARARLVAVPG